MARIWFCKLAGVVTGPLKPSELRTLAEAGKLAPEDLVRQGETGPWVPARKVRGLFRSGGQAGSDSAAPSDRSETQISQPVPTHTPLPASEGTMGDIPSGSKKAQKRLLQVVKQSELPPVPSVQPDFAGPEPVPVPVNLQAISARTDLHLGLTADFSGAVPRSGGVGLDSPSIPAAALRKQRRLQNNLLMIGALAVVAVILLVVVILILTGAISIESETQVARKQGSDVVKPVAQAAPEEPSENVELSWENASKKAVRRAGAAVRVLSVRVGQPPAAWGSAPGDYLVVEVQVKNQDEEKVLMFEGWDRGGPDGGLLKLTDNKGKTYPQVLSDASLGGERGESLKRLLPGESETETLVFRSPPRIQEVEYFRLELPAWAFPKHKMPPFRFQIPAKMIRNGEEEPSPQVHKGEELFGPLEPSDESPKTHSPKVKIQPDPPTVPMPKKDPGQEEFERLLKELQDMPSSTKQEKSPAATEEKSPESGSSASKQEKQD